MAKFKFLLVGLLFLTSLFWVFSASAVQPVGNERPGWGFGDINHTHTGPPGQSVRPENISQTSNNSVTNNVHVSAGGEGNTDGTTGETNIFVQIFNYIGQNILQL